MMDQNIFITKLLDVEVFNKESKLNQAEGIFIVMEFVAHDIRTMLDKIKSDCLSEEHVKIIMYNLLCSVNFMHSAGLMHRDIKPCNLLIDGECSIKLCDFGQSRPFFAQEDQKKFNKED
jgi:mitogen-activated protein kinase 1/3